MKIDLEMIHNIKSAGKTIQVKEVEFENTSANTAIKQDFLTAIASHASATNIIACNLGEEVSEILAQGISVNEKIKILQIQNLNELSIRKLLPVASTKISTLSFVEIDIKIVELALDLIKGQQNINSLAFQKNNINESILKKISLLPHISVIALNEPDLSAAQLFAQNQQNLPSIKTIRISGATSAEVVKVLVKAFKERIMSPQSETKAIIKEALCEFKEPHEVKKVESPKTKENNLDKITENPISITEEPKKTQTDSINTQPIKNRLKSKFIDLSNADSVSPTASPKLGTPLHILNKLNSQGEVISAINEFELKAINGQQETEEMFLTQQNKDFSLIHKRVTNLITTFANVFHSERKNNTNEKNEKSEIEKSESDKKRERPFEESQNPFKKQKILDEKEGKDYQTYRELTEKVTELKKGQQTQKLFDSLTQLKTVVQNLPATQVGFFKQKPRENTAQFETNSVNVQFDNLM